MSRAEKESAPRRETGGARGDLEGDRRQLGHGEKVPETGDGRECGDLLTFLRGWSEEGPWWPTAIPREGGKTETRTFIDLGALAKWAREKAGRFNLYFSVNDLAPDTASKASKEEVTRIRGLHVDVDPRPPADGWPKDPTPEQLAALALHFDSERARIWAMMEDWERNGAKLPFPRPTAIVDRGPSHHALCLPIKRAVQPTNSPSPDQTGAVSFGRPQQWGTGDG